VPIYSSETDSALHVCMICESKLVFSGLRKAGAEWRFLTWGGIWFQIVGPQTEKGRFPNCFLTKDVFSRFTEVSGVYKGVSLLQLPWAAEFRTTRKQNQRS